MAGVPVLASAWGAVVGGVWVASPGGGCKDDVAGTWSAGLSGLAWLHRAGWWRVCATGPCPSRRVLGTWADPSSWSGCWLPRGGCAELGRLVLGAGVSAVVRGRRRAGMLRVRLLWLWQVLCLLVLCGSLWWGLLGLVSGGG